MLADISLNTARVAHRRKLGLNLTELGEDREGSRRLLFVDPAHSEADMHQHPVADARLKRMLRIDNASDIYLAFNPGHIHQCELPALL